jgi:hypothetical protein
VLSFLGTTDTHALNLFSSDPKFKQLERFLKNVRISIPSLKGQRTITIRGLVENAEKFAFSKVRKVLLQYVLFLSLGSVLDINVYLSTSPNGNLFREWTSAYRKNRDEELPKFVWKNITYGD